MKLLDVNILLYAVNEDAPLHHRARPWLESVLSGTESVALSWNVLLAFMRLSTRPAIFPRSLTLEECFGVIESWLEQPCVILIHPTEKHIRILKDLLLPFGSGGNLSSDAHLAALALEHGTELCSCDADFGRFPGLRWLNPLA